MSLDTPPAPQAAPADSDGALRFGTIGLLFAAPAAVFAGLVLALPDLQTGDSIGAGLYYAFVVPLVAAVVFTALLLVAAFALIPEAPRTFCALAILESGLLAAALVLLFRGFIPLELLRDVPYASPITGLIALVLIWVAVFFPLKCAAMGRDRLRNSVSRPLPSE
jgi:hypothetical protein